MSITLRSGYVVSLDDNSMIKVWDTKSGQCLCTIKEQESQRYFSGIGALPDTDDCIISSSFFYNSSNNRNQGTLKLWNVKNGNCLKTINIGNEKWIPDRNYFNLIILPNGHVFVPTYDNINKQYINEILDIKSEKCLKTTEKQNQFTTWTNVTPNGFAVGCVANTLKLWDINSGECLKTLNGHTDRVSSVAILSDQHVVTSSDDKTIKVWNIETGECLQTLSSGHTDKVYDVVILPDGSLASCSKDRTIKIWELNPVLRQVHQAEKLLTEEVPECKMS